MGGKIGDLSCKLPAVQMLHEGDAVLIASSECELQALVSTLKEECENNGPRLNASKIKVLVFERNEKKAMQDKYKW